MDKYTVDLDKVLNDFEYSELTDQYSSTRGKSCETNNYASEQDVFKSTPHSTSSFKISNAKHSINNVFQSLNEYLNTDIRSPEENNEIDRENKDFEEFENTPVVNIKTDIKEFIENDLSNHSVSLKTDQDNISEYVNTRNNCNDSKSTRENEQSREDLTELKENEINCENLLHLKKDENFEENNSDVNNSCKDNNLINEEEIEIENGTSEDFVSKSVSEIQNDETENEDIKHVSEKSSKISFNSINVDDSDLEEYLKNVEEEFEKEILPEATQKVDDNLLSINKFPDDNSENDVTLKNIKSDQLYKEVQEKIENKVTETENVELKNKEEIEKKCEEISTYEEPEKFEDRELNNEKEEKSLEVVSFMSNENNLKNVEHTKTASEINDSNKNEENESITKNLEVEAPRRPSVLEVKSVVEEQPAKVNKIGKPGSTPYQFKTFDSNKDGVDSYMEDSSSTSPSPTFSDMSTVSSATTATLDSCINSLEQTTPEDNRNNPNLEEEQLTKVSENKECEETDTEQKAESSSHFIASSEETSGPSCYKRSDDATEDQNISETSYQPSGPHSWLGKQAPLWIPDSEALNCLHCDVKFTLIKRRHHCRACGLVLCSKCCNLQHRLEYLDAEARVCNKCFEILTRDNEASSGSEVSPSTGNSPTHTGSQPNPNNPMEYCSMIPPLQQVNASEQSPPTVMVPVSVLKRKGSGKARKNKSVMFCDGIRPGSELTNLDNDFNYSDSKGASHKVLASPPAKSSKNVPEIDAVTKSFVPVGEIDLPPIVATFKSEIAYKEQSNNEELVKLLMEETLTFAVQKNLYVNVRLIDMNCCMNKMAWCFSTEGLINEGQDEIVILLEYLPEEKILPKDVLLHLNNIYLEAKQGSSIAELGISLHPTSFLGSKNHAGFLYIRPTHQCLKNVIVPKEPYIIGVLIHRWEIPWAKIFPLRLVLRLGAEYKYYPSPILSFRHRESVFVEIGHTIISLLADFRNFSYTLANVRGLMIQMEDKTTTITIPTNRYDEVMKSINNSSEHILAFGGNFCATADAHLVCVQDTQGKNENNYSSLSISIQNKEVKVTGASFIVFNGNLKSTSGLSAKSSVVEDGLMIQIPIEKMEKLREDLRNMKNHVIYCGQLNTPYEETVKIIWGEKDVNFNVGVLSPIDNESMRGVPSIRVHNGFDYVCNSGNRLIRWTEVFILQNGDENSRGQDVDHSKISESIAKATCQALVKYLDLLSSNNFYKIGIRTNLHMENVSYSAGSNGIKLPPIYMKSLDNELIPILLRITSNNWGESMVVLELIFRVLNV